MGYGDDIMATAAARAAKASSPAAKILIGDGVREYWSQVFEHNPNIARLADVEAGDAVVWVKNYPGRRPYYDSGRTTRERFALVPYRPEPGDLYFTEAETAAAAEAVAGLPRFAVVEPNVKGAVSGRNKDWGWENWQSAVDRLGRSIEIVQLGDERAPTLTGVRRIVTPDFRVACAILARAALYIGPEGGLHHAAAALGKPGVVIFGGMISPENTGYDLHRNVYVDIEGSPCGMRRECEHCRRCMTAISVDEVVSAAEAMLRMSRGLIDLPMHWIRNFWESAFRLGATGKHLR